MEEKYIGYEEIELNEDELSLFHSEAFVNNYNSFNLLENLYLIIKDKDEKIVDKYKWAGGCYVKMIYEIAESKLFGKVVPKKNDVYQELAFDSLFINQVTMIRGHAGTGKSDFSFVVLFNLLDRGVIDKIIVFANTVATKGAAKLGFYPGSRTEKLMDSQIGNFLISKIGRRELVERLIED